MKEKVMDYVIPPIKWGERDKLTDWVEEGIKNKTLRHEYAKMTMQGVCLNFYTMGEFALCIQSWGTITLESGEIMPPARRIIYKSGIAEQLVSAGVITKEQ